MADRFCPNCGTEVEEGARFCPTCGTTLSAEAGEAEGAPVLPAAPAWPDAEPDASEVGNESPTLADAATQPVVPPEPEATEDRLWQEAPPVEPPPASAPPPAPPPAGAPPSPGPHRPGPAADLPITWPTMLSGWLIGAGCLVGALLLIPRLGGGGLAISWLLFLALLGIAATVFLADRVPEIPRLRLLVLVTTMIGLGIALARSAFTIQGLDTLFLVAMLAAAGGALLIELDRDRPMPPPSGPGG